MSVSDKMQVWKMLFLTTIKVYRVRIMRDKDKALNKKVLYSSFHSLDAQFYIKFAMWQGLCVMLLIERQEAVPKIFRFSWGKDTI